MKLSIYKKNFNNEFKKDIQAKDDFYLKLYRKSKDTNYDLTKSKFYGLNPPLKITNKGSNLNVSVSQNKIKTLYLTYLTLDTKFARIPEESFVDLTKSKEFYVNIEIESNRNVEVIPFIIEYDENGKKGMTRIIRPMQHFFIEEDVINVRLVFKIKGSGNFIIRSIKRRDVK